MATNGKFDYPAQGWSTGNMRMAGDTVGQSITKDEWQQFWQGNWNVVGESGQVDPTKADPNGFVIKKGHPQIKELEKSGWESYDIPASDQWSKDFQFMRPPKAEPKVAKMLPTASQAGQVVQQAAGRSRGKRKEAEAM